MKTALGRLSSSTLIRARATPWLLSLPTGVLEVVSGLIWTFPALPRQLRPRLGALLINVDEDGGELIFMKCCHNSAELCLSL